MGNYYERTRQREMATILYKLSIFEFMAGKSVKVLPQVSMLFFGFKGGLLRNQCD